LGVCGGVVFIVGTALLWLAGAGGAFAQSQPPGVSSCVWCNISARDIDFGVVPGNGTANIAGEVLSVCGKFCMNWGGEGRGDACLMIYPADAGERAPAGNNRVLWGAIAAGTRGFVPFQFYKNNKIWGGGSDNGDYAMPFTSSVSVLGYFPTDNDFSFNAAINLRNDLRPQGVYSNRYHIKMMTSDRLNPDNICSPNQGQYISETNINVKVKIVAACRLTVGGALNFGRQFSLNEPVSAQSTVTAECSGGLKYALTANAGLNPGDDGTNAMKCATPDSCGAAKIPYLVYDNGGNIWNSVKNPNFVQKGGGIEFSTDTYQLTAKTLPFAGAALPSGTYKDTIIFTLTTIAN